METPQKVDSLFVFEAGSINTIIKDNHGTIITNSPGMKEMPKEINDEMIKSAIVKFMESNTQNNKRWWFAVYRVVKDRGRVVDLQAFKALLTRMFTEGLPVAIDIHDLSKELEFGCFAEPFEKWTPVKSPVSGPSYETYCNLVVQFRKILYSEDSQS